LRTAKAKLKKAQALAKRGKASRATLAKARRAVRKAQLAVRKAQLAKKRACAPATPQGGTPGVPAPPTPDPPSQPGPPPPPPTLPTSASLIQKALDEGRIDEDTALKYRVFADFGDSRLPGEFAGSPSEVTDTDTLDEVAANWDRLSAATRQALDPFFIPPFNPGSWYEPGSPAPQLAEAGEDLCASTAPNMNRWCYV